MWQANGPQPAYWRAAAEPAGPRSLPLTGYLRTPGRLHQAAPAGAGGAEQAFGPSAMTLTAIRLLLGALTHNPIIGYSAE